MQRLVGVPLTVCLGCLVCGQVAAVEPEPLLKVLQAVGPQGEGNQQATAAWQELATAEAGQLPTILHGLDDAGPLAANWIRTAIDTIAERQLRCGGKLPADRLEMFVKDTTHAPRARRLAYEWLVRVDSTAPERLIPGMLDDPSVELRRDAVARLVREAEALADTDQAADVPRVYETALSSARDLDQVNLIAARLEDLGKQVDLARTFGFVQRWKIAGPLDNTDESGYARAYPPEREVDYKEKLSGKSGPVRWIDHAGEDSLGKIDLNKILSPEKEVCAYAVAKFVSPGQRDVQLRYATYNASKVWLNGKLVAEHNVYHGGSQMDQYVCSCRLKAGANTILVKICQNAQTQSWAVHWAFQLRVCDATGGGLLSADRK